MTVVSDHRTGWTGPEVDPAPKRSEMAALLRKYMAMHGDWDELTLHRPATGVSGEHAWRFTICQCVICQSSEKLVGHPSTPNG